MNREEQIAFDELKFKLDLATNELDAIKASHAKQSEIIAELRGTVADVDGKKAD